MIMKRFPALLVLFVTVSLNGQVISNSGIGSVLTPCNQADTLFRIPKIGDIFDSDRKFDFSLPGKSGNLPEIPRDKNIYISNLGRFENNLPDELFPGASRFYASRSYLLRTPYSENFITRPDTRNKFFLIIINPLQISSSEEKLKNPLIK